MLLTESKSGSMIRQQVQQEANRLCELHDLGTVQSEKGRWNRGIWSLPPRFFILVIVSLLTFWTFYLLIRPDVTLIVLQMFVAFVSSVFLVLYSSDYPSRYSRRFSYKRGLIIIQCKDEQIISSYAINWRDISLILHEAIKDDGIIQNTYKLRKYNGDIFPMLFYDNSIKHIKQMRYPSPPIPTISSIPTHIVARKRATMIYHGYLAPTALSITMHWGYNTWNGISDTNMSKESDGTWRTSIMVPLEATMLNFTFYNQSYIWDNNSFRNYDLSVSTRRIFLDKSHNQSLKSSGN